MTLISHRGKRPQVDAGAYVAPNAVLVGDVRVGPKARIMYGAVLDAEGSYVEVGKGAVICEHAVLRATAVGDREHVVRVGEDAFVGPHATLLGCMVEASAYIATGATVLHGAVVGAGAVVAVHGLVHANTQLPGEFLVSPNTVALGDPVRLFSADDREALVEAIKTVNFVRTAFGVETSWEDRLARYRQATRVRAEEFAAHRDDVVLDEDRDTRPARQGPC